MTAGQVDELFKENLYLSVTTESEPAALRGRILTHLAGPAECGGSAVMIRSDSSPVTGLAWASLDQTCRLHYTVRLEGSDSLHSAQPSLELEDYPIQRPSNLKARPLFPSTKRHLQDCVGPRCSGHADNIHKLMMARLDSGDAAFLLTNTGENPFQVKVNVHHSHPPRLIFPCFRALWSACQRHRFVCRGTPGTTWRSSRATSGTWGRRSETRSWWRT